MEYLGYLRTLECVRTKIIPWSCEVLCQIHLPPFDHHSTTKPCSIPERIMEVDERVPVGISQPEVTTSVLRSVSSLWSRPTVEARLWRVSLWCWGRVVPCFLEWCRKPITCVKNPHPDCQWKRVHTVGKSGTLSCLEYDRRFTIITDHKPLLTMHHAIAMMSCS